MLRVFCILIAFLVAAKEVVAFGNVMAHSEGKVYSALDNPAADVWLCECEDSTEEISEGDENDSESVIVHFLPNHAFLNNSVSQAILHHSVDASSDALRQRYISYRNLRL